MSCHLSCHVMFILCHIYVMSYSILCHISWYVLLFSMSKQMSYSQHYLHLEYCHAIRHVMSYVMFRHMSCHVLCHVMSYTMSCHMSCHVICQMKGPNMLFCIPQAKEIWSYSSNWTPLIWLGMIIKWNRRFLMSIKAHDLFRVTQPTLTFQQPVHTQTPQETI